MKEALELAVTRILENDQEVSKVSLYPPFFFTIPYSSFRSFFFFLIQLALETIKREMREATSSMTSVPKPIKFLRHHYNELKQYFEVSQNPKSYFVFNINSFV